MGNQKKYLGHFGRSTIFVTVFEKILKLVEFFTSFRESEKILRTQALKLYSKVFLKLLEFFTSCEEL